MSKKISFLLLLIVVGFSAIAQPKITSFTPTSAKPGDVVTITGTNFNTTTTNNIVFFGATKANVTAATTTSLTVTVPTGATYDYITALNTSIALMGSSTSKFIPIYSPAKTGIGAGDFTAKVDFTTGSSPYSVAIGDLDGDGKPDLAVANSNSNTVSVYRNISSTGSIVSGSFAAKVDFTTGNGPVSVVIGDLDGDGKPDLAVANYSSNTVSVLRNTSSNGSIVLGSFAAKVDFTTGLNPQSVSIGDLDGDGKPDLAVANSGSNTVSVYRNTSSSGNFNSGSFGTNVDFGTGAKPYSIAIGDLDGDSKPDLVVANDASNTVSVLRNTSSSGSIGSGSFAANVDFTTGSGPVSVGIGDLDGDGKLDLAVANVVSNTVSVLRNTSSIGSIGSGSFAVKVDFAIGSGPLSVAIGDLNGDGKPDLTTVNYLSNTVSLLRNTSSSGSIVASSFATKVDFTTGTNPYSIAIGDLDGDGKPDLVLANYTSNTLSVLQNIYLPPTITSFTPSSAKPGDVVTITGTNFNTTTTNNIVFFGATKANVTAATTTSLTVTVPTGATYDYINALNTGTALTAISTSKYIPIYSPAKTGIGAGDFATKVDFTTGTSPRSVAIGDLDGDGKSDLVVANNASNTVSVYRNISSTGSISSGSFAAKVDFTTGNGPTSVSIGDLDGDGKPDLAVATYSNTVSVLRNISSSGSISSGSFAAKVDFTTGSGPQSIAIGDLDGDGKPDLAVANFAANSVSVLRNTSTTGSIGSGSFATKVDFTTGTTPYAVAIGDLDGDGKSDLAAANYNSNSVSILRNTSSSGSIVSGSFATKVDFTTGSGPQSIAIGDLDGDGKPDLAVANGSSTVSVLRNTSSSGNIAAGSFAAKVDFTTGTQPNAVVIGDLDGDGKPDLAAANYNSNSVSILRNTSSSGSINSGSFATKVDFTAGASSYAVAIGDLDGDGKPDLAVANLSDNSVSVIRNNPQYPPTINSFSPSSGNVGSLVTITGTNLSSPTGLTIGGVAAIPISNTGTSLVAMVMPGATTGAVSVTTAGGTANGTGNFNVTASQAPNTQQGSKLVGTGNTGGSSQGFSISLSADGNTAIVGGNGDNGYAGAAWVYTRSGGSWSQQGSKLVGTGAVGAAQQGYSVSLSADGNTAIVGGYGDNSGVGAAWVFTRTGGSWSQQGSKLVGTSAVGNAQQGASVSLSADGNTAIVGGYGDNSGTGAAWVYTRTGGSWSQQGSKLVGTGAVRSLPQQGLSVGLSADGNTAIVGGNADNNFAGAAWVYTRSGGSWSQQGSKLVGTGAVGAANQGNSVSLSADGNTAIVGGYYDNSGTGAAWVFTRTSGSWSQQGSKLVGTGAIGNAYQGYSISLSADGNTAIVGGYGDNSSAGAAWVFTRTSGSWSQQGSKLVGTGAAGNAQQGYSVSLSADGNTTIVGGYNDNSYSGAAWVYVYVPTPIITTTGTLAAVNTTYGTASSSPTSFIISGSNLTNDISINPPNGFEISSTSSSSGYTSSITLTQSGGTVNTTTIYVRLKATATVAASPYSGNVVCSSTGATSQNVATASSTVSAAALTITASAANKTYGSTLTGAAGSTAFTSSGLVNSETIGSVTVAYGTGAAATASVGTYTGSVTPSAATGGTFTASNYNITYATGNIVVGQATLTITASAANKTYGSTLSGAAGSTSFTSSGLVNSETIGSVTVAYGTGSAATAAVGTYTGSVTLSAATGGTFTASNYNITYATGNIVVGQAALTITANNANKIYGSTLSGAAGSTSFTSSGLVNSETIGSVTVAYGTGAAATAAVGTYTGSVTLSAATGGTFTASNYNITYATGNIVVGQAALTITANNANKIYGSTLSGAAGSTSFTSSGLVNSETIGSVTVAYGTGAAATAAVGTYTGSVTPSAATGGTFTASNYNITYATGNIVVGQAALTITASAANKTYGSALSGAAGSTSFTSSGLVNSETIGSVTVAYGTGAAATAAVGTYTGSVTPSAATGGTFTASNYNITYATGNIVVGQATLTITASAASKTYGTVASLTAYTTSGLVGTDAVSGLTLSSTGTAATAAVGTYDIVPSGATGTGLTNYAITYTNGTLTVNQAALTITASASSKTYGTVASLTAYTTSGLVNSDAVNGLTLSSSGTAATAAVGAYNIVPSGATGTGLTNYAITYTNGTLTVNQAALTITASGSSKTYGTVASLTAYTTSGLVNSDAINALTLSSTGTAATAAVGTYNIVPSGATGTGLTNYAITYTNGTLTVNQAALTITASAASKTYGTVASLTAYTTSGLVGTDAVSGLTLSSTGTAATAAVGTYNIVPSGATGTGLTNYAITYTNGTLTVNQAALTITASAASKTYGTVASLTAYTTSGLVGTDAVSGLTLSSTGTAATANVGTYDIVPSGATGTGLTNYAITYTNGTLTVNQAALTITASAASKTYGTVASLTAYTTSGLVGTDAVSGLTLSSTGTAATANVGTYDIVPSGATGTGLTNYAITYTNGTLTVNQAPLTITATNQSKCFGLNLTLPANGYSVNGLLNSDAVSSVTLSSSGATGTAAINTYPITISNATGTGLSNYNISYANGVLNVIASATITTQPITTLAQCAGTSAQISVSATGSPNFSYQWLLNGTAINGATNSTYTVPSLTAANAGSYTVIVTPTGGCAPVTSNASVWTVNALPTPSAITIPSLVCTGLGYTLTNSLSGGVWSSSNTGVATINASGGLVTPISQGNTTISYVVTDNFGCTGTVTAVLPVLTTPAKPVITRDFSGNLNSSYTGVNIWYNASNQQTVSGVSSSSYNPKANIRVQVQGNNGGCIGPWSDEFVYTTSSIATLYPNPASSYTVASVVSDRPQSITLQLTDMAGKLLQEIPVTLGTGQNPVRINTATLARGSYMLVIKGSGVTYMQFVKE